MDCKKILHIVTKGSPFGGAQKYVYTLATELPGEQFESVVIVGVGDELPNKLIHKRIKVIQIPELGRDVFVANEIKSLWQLTQIIHEEKPAIVHLNSSKIGALGSLAISLLRVYYFVTRQKTQVPRTVFTVHGWAFNEKRSYIQIKMIMLVSWISVLMCDEIIVIAKKEELQGLNMPFAGKKINLVHNGIEEIEFKEKKVAREFLTEKVSKKSGHIDSDTFWIGTIAELHPNKNLQNLILAVRNIIKNTDKKIVMLIIGEGEQKNYLKALLEENEIDHKILIAGKIENAGTYLKAFDLFALPSIKEGLPYTLLEAGLAGLPCLSSYVGGIPEIIRNNVSGILVEPTLEKIQGGLELLIANPEKAKEFGENLKEKVQKDFSLEKMLEETIKVYNTIEK